MALQNPAVASAVRKRREEHTLVFKFGWYIHTNICIRSHTYTSTHTYIYICICNDVADAVYFCVYIDNV